MFTVPIRFVYAPLLYGLMPLLAAALWYRWSYYQHVVYRYSMVALFIRENAVSTIPYRKIIHGMRFVSLLGLALLIARPQQVDKLSKVHVDGIDIMLALDVSGSMQLFDDLNDRRLRIDVAKQEAIKFIQKRDNDPIGLVLFAHEAVSRCPLTLDKKMLETIIKDTDLGVINPEGTMLSKGLIMALNRLKRSKSKSKIIILLTDGDSTPGDFNPQMAIDLAKKLHVKIYTIGIGGNGGYFEHPMFGIKKVGMPLDAQLLQMLSEDTGGKSFLAKRPQDVETIYNYIDELEKTEYETDVYHKYHDIFMPLLWILIGLVAGELFLSRFMWFGV